MPSSVPVFSPARARQPRVGLPLSFDAVIRQLIRPALCRFQLLDVRWCQFGPIDFDGQLVELAREAKGHLVVLIINRGAMIPFIASGWCGNPWRDPSLNFALFFGGGSCSMGHPVLRTMQFTLGDDHEREMVQDQMAA
jgi:hypothetical protein